MKHKLLLIALAATLSACGGGGGDDSTTAASAQSAAPQPAPTVTVAGDMTKYAGTWTSVCMTQGQQTVRMSLVLTATQKSATGRMVADAYNQANCGGPSAQLSIPFNASFAEMSGNAEKLSVSDGFETGAMLATFSADGRSLTLVDGEDTFAFTKN
jgi:invasion protein IalB